MNETLSTRQGRLVALVGLVVVLAAGYWILVAHKTTSQPSAVQSTPSATTPTAPAPGKTHTHTSAPPAQAKSPVGHGLSAPIARALESHSIVVVELYEPAADLDQLASGEAAAGAAASGVGYVHLNVNKQRNGTAMLHKLGVVDTPAVLVVKRPNLVYAHFQGFVDRGVVEQAVADARG